jgi:hypothetical protein
MTQLAEAEDRHGGSVAHWSAQSVATTTSSTAAVIAKVQEADVREQYKSGRLPLAVFNTWLAEPTQAIRPWTVCARSRGLRPGRTVAAGSSVSLSTNVSTRPNPAMGYLASTLRKGVIQPLPRTAVAYLPYRRPSHQKPRVIGSGIYREAFAHRCRVLHN